MDEVIHWPKPYLFLSTNCNEILSWMIKIWMQNHLVSDSFATLYNPLPKKTITRNDK